MASKGVAFVLVPGSFSPPTAYRKVTPILESKGYTVVPTQLQSAVVQGTRPAATFQEDMDHIHNTVANLLEEGKDVVLALSSYAGFPGSVAAKGLSRAERGEGNGGALIGLVYLASFLPPVGQSLVSLFGMMPGVPNAKDNAYLDLSMDSGDEKAPDVIFNDLPVEERQAEYDQFVNQSAAALEGPVTFEGFKTIPSTYVLCELDRVVPPTMQRDMIKAANDDGANVRTVPIQAGHCLMVSQPEKTVEILLEAAGQKL